MNTLHAIYREVLGKNRSVKVIGQIGDTYNITVFDAKRCEGYSIYLAPERRLSEIHSLWDLKSEWYNVKKENP